MKILVSLLCTALLLNASELLSSSAITLDEAINSLKSQNLEIKAAALDVNSAKEDAKTATGNHYGKLEFIQDVARSNDAGNVFGFKLTSREADFGDFGFDEFLSWMNGGMVGDVLSTQPKKTKLSGF